MHKFTEKTHPLRENAINFLYVSLYHSNSAVNKRKKMKLDLTTDQSSDRKKRSYGKETNPGELGNQDHRFNPTPLTGRLQMSRKSVDNLIMIRRQNLQMSAKGH